MRPIGCFVSLFTFVAKPEEIEQDRQRLEAEHDMAVAVVEIEHPTLSGTVCTRVTWQEDEMAKTPIGPREARLRELREARVAKNKKPIDRKTKPTVKPKGKKRGRG
jgi:hypothetical protein